MLLNNTSKRAWKIAYPVLFSGLAENLINISDTAFLGHVGIAELGAIGLATIWCYAFSIFGVGVCSALQIMVARAAGEHNDSAIGKITDQTIIFSMGLGILLFGFFQLASPTLFSMTCSNPEIAEKGNLYIFYRSFGIVFLMMGLGGSGFFNGIESNRIIIWSTLLTGVSDVIMNYVLIFGKFGFPEMGIAGAAISSAIAEGIGAFTLMGYAYFTRLRQTYGLFRFQGFDRATFIRLVNLSSPIVFQQLVAMLSFYFFLATIEGRGEIELATSNLVKNVYILFMVPTWAFGSAVSTIVSHSFGQKQYSRVVPYARSVIGLSLVFSLVSGLILILIPELALTLFTTDAQVIEQAKPLLWIIYLSLTIFSISCIWVYTIIGVGASIQSMVVEFIACSIYVLYILYATYFSDSLNVIWYAEVVYMTMLGILAYSYVRSFRWIALKPTADRVIMASH
jgi:putative MATE family efflux protein